MSGDYYKRHDECPGCRPQPYADFEAFKKALAEYGELNQVNVDTANDWRIAKDVAANGYRCTCQVNEPVCPCHAGKRMAYEEGECACGLLYTDRKKMAR